MHEKAGKSPCKVLGSAGCRLITSAFTPSFRPLFSQPNCAQGRPCASPKSDTAEIPFHKKPREVMHFFVRQRRETCGAQLGERRHARLPNDSEAAANSFVRLKQSSYPGNQVARRKS